jgi:hypothetical protein
MSKCQTEHPLYVAGGTASVLAPSMAAMARDYRQQPIHVSEVDGEVVTLHRQNQVRQLKDTCPINGLCIYNYQLTTQVDGIYKFIYCTNLCTDQKPDSKEAWAMGKWGQSPIYTVSHDPQEIERSPFRVSEVEEPK